MAQPCSREVYSKLVLVLSFLAALALCAPASGLAAEAQNTDIVFLVDSSGGIIRSDATNSRDFIIEAMATTWAGQKGDRIAVGLYSGWNESTKNLGALVRFGLTELPESTRERKGLAAEIAASLAKAPPKAIASDINAALQVVLPEILKDKKEEGRRTWVIVITDGDMNVIEGSKVRKEYIDASAKSFGKVDPDTLPKAATNILFNETLPKLKDENVTVTLLGIGTKPNRPGFVFTRGKDKFASVVINERGEPLSKALRELTGGQAGKEGGRSFSYGAASKEIAPGEEAEIPFELYAGTRDVRISLFGSHGEFSATLAQYPDVDIASSKPFRIIDIEQVIPGAHTLKITNKGSLPLAITFSINCVADISLQIKWPEIITEHLMGAPINMELSLVKDDGSVVEDKTIVEQVECNFAVSSSAPELANTTTSLGELVPHEYSFSTDSLPGGDITIISTFKAFKAGDTYLYTSPSQIQDIKLMPGFEVNFAKSEALLAQDVTITATQRGEMSSVADTITIKVDPDGEIILGTGDEQSFTATEKFSSVGTRTITRQVVDDYLIIGGANSTLDVREMTLRILSATPPHAPLEAITFDMPFNEVVATEGSAADVIIAFDFAQDASSGEITAVVTPTFTANATIAGANRAGDISFEVTTDGVISPAGQLKAKLVPSVSNVEFLPNGKEGFLGKLPWPEVNIGTLKLDCSVDGMEVTETKPLIFAYGDFWQKAAKLYAKYWIPAAVLLLLIILFILSLLFKARFVIQQLRIADTLTDPTGAVYKLASLSESAARRKAIGTPEVSDSVNFRIKGSKLFGKGKVAAKPMTEECKVEVKGAAITTWTKLQHGDPIRVENVDGQSCDYFYFAHEPTEAELEALSVAGKVMLGPDEFIIEGLD